MIKIIDYRAGNAASVANAITHLGYHSAFARTPQDLTDASHIILPGVGDARATMDSLQEMGILPALEEAVIGQNEQSEQKRQKKLFLGICVGLQVLFEHSEESNTDCLGWLKGKVVRFNSDVVRVPQMGWNNVRFTKMDKKTATTKDAEAYEITYDEAYFYFVNSYYAVPEDKNDIWGVADYNGEFAAAVQKDNIYATQFHIEKSGEAGLALLRRFLDAN